MAADLDKVIALGVVVRRGAEAADFHGGAGDFGLGRLPVHRQGPAGVAKVPRGDVLIMHVDASFIGILSV